MASRPAGRAAEDELRKGHVSARPTGLDGLRGRTLDDTRHAGTLLELLHSNAVTQNKVLLLARLAHIAGARLVAVTYGR